MKIISASRRTDIPAFYSRWLLNRLDAGFCHWINPFGGQVYRVSLRPEDCLAIVFWTRNPLPLLPYLRDLQRRGYRFYFHVTINGYPPDIEHNNPAVDKAVAAFRALSDLIGPAVTHWRYDPIVISDRTPPAYHIEQFDRLSAALEGATERCSFSFLDFYGKTRRNLARLSRERGITFEDPDVEHQRTLVAALAAIARARAIALYACCEAPLVDDGAGVAASKCIDSDMIRLLRGDADVRLKAAPTRDGCGCAEAVDIGAYDTCAFGCAYCYATNSAETARLRVRAHDPSDTVLWRPSSLRGVDLTEREFTPGSKRRLAAPEQLPLLPSDRPPDGALGRAGGDACSAARGCARNQP